MSALTKLAKVEVAYAIGALGGALTLLGQLDPLIWLASWARFVVEHWRSWALQFWDIIFWWNPYKIPREIKMLLTFFVFIFLLIDRAIRYPPNEAEKTKWGPHRSPTLLFFLTLFATAILMDGASYLFSMPTLATAIWIVTVIVTTAIVVSITCVSFLVFLSRRGLYPRYTEGPGQDRDRGRFFWMVEGFTTSLVRVYLWLIILVILNYFSFYGLQIKIWLTGSA